MYIPEEFFIEASDEIITPIKEVSDESVTSEETAIDEAVITEEAVVPEENTEITNDTDEQNKSSAHEEQAVTVSDSEHEESQTTSEKGRKSLKGLDSLIDLIPDAKAEMEAEEAMLEEALDHERYTKDVSVTVAYLLGVKRQFMNQIFTAKEHQDAIEKLEKNQNALIIRTLNSIRTNLMLYFKKVARASQITAAEYKAIYEQDEFRDDFKILRRFDIKIEASRSDINEYIKNANKEIESRLVFIKPLFPDWVKFEYISNMFRMPANIETVSKKFQANQSCYPYKRYFNWNSPSPQGNIIQTDFRLLQVIYEDNGDSFTDFDRVRGASTVVFKGISDFIKTGKKTWVFIDGENTSPYKFQAMLDSLSDDELDQIEQIVAICDKKYSIGAWDYLEDYAFGIPVDIVRIERLIDEKSLVDHTLIIRLARAVYRDGVDSIILASSDSDFWSVISDFTEEEETLKEEFVSEEDEVMSENDIQNEYGIQIRRRTAPVKKKTNVKFMVLVEEERCSYNFKNMLWKSNVFYCYLDRFKVPKNNEYFKVVLTENVYNLVRQYGFTKSFKKIFGEAIYTTYNDVSDTEKQSLYERYRKNLKIFYDDDGILQIKYTGI